MEVIVEFDFHQCARTRGCEKSSFNCHATIRDNQDFLRTQNKKVIDYQEFISIMINQRTLLSSIPPLWIYRIAVQSMQGKTSLLPRVPFL